MLFFKWLDKIAFLNIKVWDFSVNSLLRSYGIAFLFRVALRHPVKTITGIRKYQNLTSKNVLTDSASLKKQSGKKHITDKKSITGVGFCLKPVEPLCISGRANHSCKFFESDLYLQNGNVPLCCRNCLIKKIGLWVLSSKSSFYIMTSAKDILYDMIIPSVKSEKFSKGLFCICKFSFEPFKIALSIAGIEAGLFSFESGDCRDYKTWLKADIGIKNEQTELSMKDIKLIEEKLSMAKEGNNYKFKKVENIFYAYD